MNAVAELWRGDFGREYHARDVREVEATTNLFRRALRETGVIRSALEFGAGTGTNLQALKSLYGCRTVGVEVNPDACARMTADAAICSPALECAPQACKLVLTKGFLIHVPPEDLEATYAKIYACSTRYVLLCEYFNPAPVEVEYRGHRGRLWKRDFAGEMLDAHPDLALLDYGFSYGRDPQMPGDNMNWFLLDKAQ